MYTVNEMVFMPKCYNDDTELMWLDVFDFIHSLMKNEYVCTVTMEDEYVVVRYDNADERLGGNTPKWISEDEWFSICDSRNSEEVSRILFSDSEE